MSGNQRIIVGAVTQSSAKGKALENTLSKGLNSTMPAVLSKKKEAKKKK